MDFARTARELFNRLRAFQPWPGAFTMFKGRKLQVYRAHPMRHSVGLALGEIAVEGTRLFVGCGNDLDGDTTLELFEVQLEGKRRMTAQEFINGYRPKSGDHLGQ
jgi:methionyl-tRNA formyltransferase